MARADEFASFIQARMAQLGINTGELAHRCGVTYTGARNWRLRGTIPRLPLLPRLAEALELDLATVARAAGYALPGVTDQPPRMAECATIAEELRAWLAQGAALAQRLAAAAA